MSGELTPWFSWDVNPARVGVYPRDDSGTDCYNGLPAYSHWNGRWWGQLCMSEDSAQRMGKYQSNFQCLPWRDLAADPSVKVSP